jgi:O-acetyl-ADP-ribose deacetylase (regulator of RNase III)
MITFKNGNMFEEQDVDFLVNTVNCVGVMGKGVALTAKKLYPAMFRDYRDKCNKGQISPGSVTYYVDYKSPVIINVATKNHWSDPSHIGWINKILKILKDDLTYATIYRPDIKIVFPALGCGNGGLDWNEVRPMMEAALSDLPCNIIIYEPVVETTYNKRKYTKRIK